jgi:hypothetical protein
MEKEKKETTVFVAYDGEQPFDPAAPEKNLLVAILTNAMNDAKRSGDDRQRAVEYLLSPDEEYIFSFRSICNLLDIDPSVVLQVIGLETVFQHSMERFRKKSGRAAELV